MLKIIYLLSSFLTTWLYLDLENVLACILVGSLRKIFHRSNGPTEFIHLAFFSIIQFILLYCLIMDSKYANFPMSLLICKWLNLQSELHIDKSFMELYYNNNGNLNPLHLSWYKVLRAIERVHSLNNVSYLNTKAEN